jgi:hypothetical protein
VVGVLVQTHGIALIKPKAIMAADTCAGVTAMKRVCGSWGAGSPTKLYKQAGSGTAIAVVPFRAWNAGSSVRAPQLSPGKFITCRRRGLCCQSSQNRVPIAVAVEYYLNLALNVPEVFTIAQTTSRLSFATSDQLHRWIKSR